VRPEHDGPKQLAEWDFNRYIPHMTAGPTAATEIAAKGAEIYERKYRSEFEREHQGQFVAIDIGTERAFLADFPEEALSVAKQAAPAGIFFLLRVGSSGAFKLSRVAHAARGSV
jgi:hypothetical protein